MTLSPEDVPGLKRMMARRQPSSVLSICMSLILLTSSVSTLRRGGRSRSGPFQIGEQEGDEGRGQEGDDDEETKRARKQ